jgi:hypothetical protein
MSWLLILRNKAFLSDGAIKVGAFYWTDMSRVIVNPEREVRGSISI